MPFSMRPQAHEIIRTWAFYTIAKSMLHDNTIPWKSICISGWVVDSNKQKVSKSAGNATETPLDLIEKFGADGVRYWSATSKLGSDTIYDETQFKIGKRLATKILNASKLILDSKSGTTSTPIVSISSIITNKLDIALLSRLRTHVKETQKQMEQNDFSKALRETESFFWSYFTDNYLGPSSSSFYCNQPNELFQKWPSIVNKRAKAIRSPLQLDLP